MFHFFSHVVLLENLNANEEKQFSQFLVNCLQFLDFNEIQMFVPDFNKDFELILNPIFKLLVHVGDTEDRLLVKRVWVQIATVYKKRQVELMPVDDDEKKNLDFTSKAEAFVDKEIAATQSEQEREKIKDKIAAVKSDIPELLNFCAMFYT